ncbi:GNAT family N-acetyltransferase [Streptomyces amakusaensis]|uniref:GNAT family N-acetyltransferase n=1 Tax=Streptomyces amakusaensis TaxID=67271 RepID=A0ABW0AW33_9ACTN
MPGSQSSGPSKGSSAPRLFRAAYPDWRASQAAEIRANCQPEKHPCWVAEHEGHTVGWVALVHEAGAPVAMIEMLAVDPARQGKGIATALIGTAMDEARSRGCTRIEVWTGGDPGHEPARRTYDKAGFTALPLIHYYREL